jgi:hypothetical protein
MTQDLGRTAFVLVLLALAGCNKGDGAAAASTTASTSAPAPASTLKSDTQRALAKAAAPTVTKLVHNKVTMDECTFDFDAPEALQKTKSDGTSITYAGKLTGFQGFVGASLDDFDGIAATKKPADTLYFNKDGDPQLSVARVSTATDPLFGVMGNGNEKRPENRKSGLGCSFLCSGTKAAEGDVVAMCRSVKITYDEKKVK